MQRLIISQHCPIHGDADYPHMLHKALRDAIELADEGWSYASDYFVEKWDFIERRNKLASLVGIKPIGPRDA